MNLQQRMIIRFRPLMKMKTNLMRNLTNARFDDGGSLPNTDGDARQ